MAKQRVYLKVICALALAGTLFAGYLSASKALTGACAFNESCPYFLGYPACWFGLAMFLAMFITALLALASKLRQARAAKIILAVATLGIIFAGSFVWQEVASWLASAGSPGYGLVLPTCVYGLVFYVGIFVAAYMVVTRQVAGIKKI